MPNTLLIKKATIETFLTVMCYGMFFFCFQLFLNKISLSAYVPDNLTLERWDAGIYHVLAQKGYYYHTEQDNNAGLYILFPWVWKLLHVGVTGISFFNLVFFALGFTIVTSIYSITLSEKILWLTTPSLYFMWVPYTEALFCLLSAISFYGIVTKNRWLTWAGLFLVSLCRATAVFLIPALLIMELISNSRKEFGKSIYSYTINYALPTILGSATFVFIQYAYTGQWFPYFKGQAKYLGHTLSWPKLPFDNFYGGPRVTWLCALAMLPCVIALLFLFRKAYYWLTNNKTERDKIWLLTLGYLPIVLFTMIFCNPKWGNGRTNLLGIHRYVFCSPYIFVFFHHITNHKYKWKHFVLIILVANVVWLTMGSYWHIQFLLFYNFLSLLAVAYMLHANKNAWATTLLSCINFFFQVCLFQQYLSGLFTD